MLQNNRPKVQFKAQVTEVEDLTLGDYVNIIRPDLNIRYETRVFKLTRNLLNENFNEVEFGDNIASTPMDKLNSVSNSISGITDTVQRVEEEIDRVDATGVHIHYGKDEPTQKKKGDIWYKDTPDGETVLMRWNGDTWEEVISNKVIEEINTTVEQAMKDSEQAKQNATNAVQKADELTQQVTELDVNISVINNHLRSSNIIQNPEPMFTLVDYPKTQDSVSDGDWQKMDSRVNNKEILPKNITTFSAESKTKYTQQIEIMTDGTLDSLTFSFYTTYGGHRPVQAELITLSEGCYIAYASWTATETTDVRVCDIKNIIFTGSYIKFRHPKIEEGEYTPYYVEAKNTVEAIKKVEETTNGFISEVSDMTFFHKENLIGTLEPMPTLNAYPSSVVSIDDNGWAKFSNTLQEQEVLPISAIMISVEAEQKYTQQITIETDGNLEELTFTFYCNNSHNKIPSNIIKQSDNRYIAYSSWTPSSNGSLRCVDIKSLTIEGGSYVKFCHPKVEKGDYTAYTLSDAMNNATAQISKIEQTQNGIKTTVQDNTGKISQVTQTVDGFDKKVQNIEGQMTQNTQTVQGMQSTVSNLDGRVTQNTQNINGVQTTVRDHTDKISQVTQTVEGLQSTVKDNKNNISQLTQTSQSLQSSISDLTHSTNSKISQLSDRVNLKVSKGEVSSMIDVAVDGITIAGNKVHITGDTTIDNAVIKDAMIANLSASKLTAGTIDASKINVTNLDVNTLAGNKAEFLETIWADSNSYSKITPDGMRFYQSADGVLQKDSYLNIYSNELRWKTSSPQWHYLSEALEKGVSLLTMGAVTNGGTKPAAIALRSSGYNNLGIANKSGYFSGEYLFLGGFDTKVSQTDGQLAAFTDLRLINSAFGDNFPMCYRMMLNAKNDISLCASDGGTIRFYGASGLDAESTSLVWKNDNSRGMILKSLSTYNRTYSYSPNLYITSNGYIGRATSARKYKENIEYIDNLEEAKRVLDIQPAEWADKEQMMSHARVRAGVSKPEDEERLARRYIGFIADDFADAGFEKLVVRDDKGEVEEFQYNRLSVYHHQLIKDLYNQVEELKQEIKELKGK